MLIEEVIAMESFGDKAKHNKVKHDKDKASKVSAVNCCREYGNWVFFPRYEQLVVQC